MEYILYGIVFKRLKSHASFIRCRIKRLLLIRLFTVQYGNLFGRVHSFMTTPGSVRYNM